jgi:uncharacterized protein YciI
MWYLMLSHTDLPPVSADVSKEALTDHFAFLKRQHAAGNILFSGPTPDRSLGIYVIKANSHDEAVAIAAEDPMHTYKVRRAEVIDWEVHQIMGAGFKN